MASICGENETKCLIPIIDVITRWNSTFDMLVRARNIRETIHATIYRHQDNGMIKLLLDEDDWKCIDDLILILEPLKEATLIASKNAASLMITNILPIYQYCTEALEECLVKFAETDDIYIGIEAAIQKLYHYYDNISPMVGIALILNPTMKFDMLRKLNWKEEWINSAEEHFKSAFEFYSNAAGQQNKTVSSTEEPENIFSRMKKRKMGSNSTSLRMSGLDIEMLLLKKKKSIFWTIGKLINTIILFLHRWLRII